MRKLETERMNIECGRLIKVVVMDLNFFGAAHLPQWSNRLILLMEIIYSLFMTFCFGHEPWKLREIEGQVVLGAKASLEPIPSVCS